MSVAVRCLRPVSITLAAFCNFLSGFEAGSVAVFRLRMWLVAMFAFAVPFDEHIVASLEGSLLKPYHIDGLIQPSPWARNKTVCGKSGTKNQLPNAPVRYVK